MLTLEVLNASRDLVALLADKGVRLRPVAGSPIAEAMNATPLYGDKIDCMSKIDALPAKIYQPCEPVIENGEMKEDLHSAYMEGMSTQLGVVLAGHISHATTVVIPAVHELHNKIKEIQNTEERAGIRGFKVEMVTGSPLFDVPAISSEIEKNGKITPQGDQELVLDYKEISDEELIKLMKIGAEAYDTAIDQFIANEGIENIREVYNVVFAGNRGEWKTYDAFRADRELGETRNFATFLIANRLITDADGLPEPTGLSGMSNAKYVFALRNLIEISGKALFTMQEYLRSQEKIGKLIVKVDNKTVYVGKSVYDRFMDDGGDIETILGAVVSGEKSTYVNQLNENVEKYKQAWDYHVAVSKRNLDTGMLMDVRRTIYDYIRLFIRESEEPVIKSNIQRILDNAEEFVSRVYVPDLKDIDTLALRAVCDTLFNHTDAKQILLDINEAMTENPDITKEDALNLAVLQYTACWFADQIEIDE